MRTAVAQFGPSAEPAANLAVIEDLVAEAARQNAGLVILPEESMLLAGEVGLGLEDLVARTWPRFVSTLTRLATSHRVAIIAGGYEPSGSSRPNNTIVAVDSTGVVAAEYRKLHLYDAFAYRESDYVTPGTQLPPVVDLDGLRVGLVNCYDIRFPEVARHLMQHGAELLAVPAAWVNGPHKKDHWLILNRARAIENTVWVAAAGAVSDDCLGSSLIVDPMGEVVADLGDEPQAVVVAEVSTDRTVLVRHALPALENRRIALTYQVLEHS